MKTFKKIAVGLAVIAAAGGSFAAPTITNADGTFSFGGFDWAQNGSVWIQGYDALAGRPLGFTDTFTLRYQSFATSVLDANGTVIPLTNLRAGSGSGYEYTISAFLNETVTCITAGCTAVTITPGAGTWVINYQAVGNALAAGLSGILDGTQILSGVFTGGDTILGAQGGSNPGSITLAGTFNGTVLSTNNAFIVPNLNGTQAVSTLQFGANVTAWTRPGTWDGIGAIGADTNTDFVGQADANQNFSVIPEPGSLALVGLALGGAAMVGRRRKQA
jgi:PEP-CTERM motif